MKFHHHLSVDKKVVDELLLVCGVIGSTVDPETQEMLPVEDCINWLQDLQRALRRDEDAYRPISLLLGQWKVVGQKLLPLVLSCRYNTPLLLTVVKILVILTKPLSSIAVKAGKVIIDTKKTVGLVIKEQILLRDNAIAQANLLAEYKKLFVHHPSHRSNKKPQKSSAGNNEEGGLLSVLVSLLADPLSRTGVARTADDHLTIELVLHLFRNLLCAGEPILKDAEKAQNCAILHQQLIGLFEKEMVLDFMLVVGQEMDNRENKDYNLLLMEILHHMLKNQDPTLVARSINHERGSSGKEAKVEKKKKGTGAAERFRGPQSRSSGSGILANQLKKERNQMQSSCTSRHSYFGGTLVTKRSDGQQRYVSTTATQQMASSRGAVPLKSKSSLVGEKRKSKKQQHFVGSGRTYAIHSRNGVPTSNSSLMSSPASLLVQQSLHGFCERFMEQCYGPVMKSLKNEFRRDSSKLEIEDKIIFFRLIWFFSQWWRVAVKEGGVKFNRSNSNTDDGINPHNSSIGQLIFTMDVFTFKLVLSSWDFFLSHKRYNGVTQSVALYVEMTHLLSAMYHSSDSTEQIMAMGLMDNLFYQSEPLDKLPKLLSLWVPGTYSREYLCDLVELTHVTLKLLESNAKACEKHNEEGKRNKQKMHRDHESQDAIMRMRTNAAYFDTVAYFSRKVISNQTVFMFTQLLSQYSINATNINDHIVELFVKLCKFIVIDDTDDDFFKNDEEQEKQKVTLEPMLFNIPMLSVMNAILNDSSLRDNPTFKSLLNFASTLIRHYSRACEKNPMIHVESLFKHAMPLRFCESISNMYVTEEIKMIAERDMLIEQSKLEDGSDSEDEDNKVAPQTKTVDEEGEMEFVDDGKVYAKQTTALTHNDDEDISVNNDAPTTNQTENTDIKAIEKELDEDEERWNDRRSFVPKRKITQSSEPNKRPDEEDLFCAGSEKGSLESTKRIRRKTLLEDSDDDEAFGTFDSKPTRTLIRATPTRNFLDDSDEE